MLKRNEKQKPEAMETNFFSEAFDYKIISFLSFLTFLIVYRALKHGKSLPLPPGPPKLPAIGNMHLVSGPAPHRSFWELAKKYGPLMHLKLGSVSTIIISSAEVAEEVMKNKDRIFANRPKLAAPEILGYNYTDVAFAQYGSYWKVLRKICVQELLNGKRINSFRSLREEEVALLVQSIASSSMEPVDIAKKLFAFNHDITTRIIFGKKFEDQEEFRAAMKQGTSLAAGFHIGDFFPSLSFIGVISGMKAKLKRNFLELDRISDRIIREHIMKNKLNSPEKEDLVDVLLRLKDSGELEVTLTIDNIKAVILDMFTAGTESSSNTIEWAMAELIKNPEMMKKAQSEVREAVSGNASVKETDLPKLIYLKSIIKETLRFHPPVPFLLPRESMEECAIKGYRIPNKTRAIINYWAIGRDPTNWENPEEFDPDRFMGSEIDLKGQNFEFIPFGSGRRVCPGISFAAFNMELSLAALLFHFDWRLPEDENAVEMDMSETFGLTMFKSSSLKLFPILRFPLFPESEL